ncbi:MAG: ribokinase [Erysipelothrix sp.]|nr:ribokinase [Erysipelothrix sp.]
MKNILVVGSINNDITLHMENLPLPGETVIAHDLKTSLGGKGANQAVAAARMGAPVHFIGAIGNDLGSQTIIEQLNSDHINTTGIDRVDINTGTAYISIDSHAENNIIVYPGANFAIIKEHLEANTELFEKSDYCLLQLEIPLDIIKETIRLCKEHDVKVILNPAPYHDGIDEEMLKNVDYYIPNEIEFLATLKLDTTQSHPLGWIEVKALEFVKKHNLTLIVTLGGRGALLVQEEQATLIPAQKMVPIDTTAAGDSFIGGFLAALSQGQDIVESLKLGSRVAAITISRYGAISAIPYKEELK